MTSASIELSRRIRASRAAVYRALLDPAFVAAAGTSDAQSALSLATRYGWDFT